MMGEERIAKRGLWGAATHAIRSRLRSTGLFPSYHFARNDFAYCRACFFRLRAASPRPPRARRVRVVGSGPVAAISPVV